MLHLVGWLAPYSGACIFCSSANEKLLSFKITAAVTRLDRKEMLPFLVATKLSSFSSIPNLFQEECVLSRHLPPTAPQKYYIDGWRFLTKFNYAVKHTYTHPNNRVYLTKCSGL